MNHFPFSLGDLFVFLLYGAWFVFLVWFVIRLVRALRALEDIGNSLRVMTYDLREISDNVKQMREKNDNLKDVRQKVSAPAQENRP